MLDLTKYPKSRKGHSTVAYECHVNESRSSEGGSWLSVCASVLPSAAVVRVPLLYGPLESLAETSVSVLLEGLRKGPLESAPSGGFTGLGASVQLARRQKVDLFSLRSLQPGHQAGRLNAAWWTSRTHAHPQAQLVGSISSPPVGARLGLCWHHKDFNHQGARALGARLPYPVASRRQAVLPLPVQCFCGDSRSCRQRGRGPRSLQQGRERAAGCGRSAEAVQLAGALPDAHDRRGQGTARGPGVVRKGSRRAWCPRPRRCALASTALFGYSPRSARRVGCAALPNGAP